jgi:hypothetical protein
MWSRVDNKELFLNIIEYLAGYSDLELVKLKVRRKLTPGKNQKFVAKIRNRESCYSCTTNIAFYLSEDDALNTKKDILLGTAEVPAGKPRSVFKIKRKYRIPNDIPGGAIYAFAIINYNGETREIIAENSLASKKCVMK